MILDPKIWGPSYWFTLHTIALCYPHNPNEVTKKKYYDFIQNTPLFIPIDDIGNTFSRMLDKYPVTPYLDSRESFMKWVHFIHNKMNAAIDKPSVSMEAAMSNYYDKYKPKVVINKDQLIRREKVVFISSTVAIILLAYFFYER